jgi:hypothetical protein
MIAPARVSVEVATVARAAAVAVTEAEIVVVIAAVGAAAEVAVDGGVVDARPRALQPVAGVTCLPQSTRLLKAENPAAASLVATKTAAAHPGVSNLAAQNSGALTTAARKIHAMPDLPLRAARQKKKFCSRASPWQNIATSR